MISTAAFLAVPYCQAPGSGNVTVVVGIEGTTEEDTCSNRGVRAVCTLSGFVAGGCIITYGRTQLGTVLDGPRYIIHGCIAAGVVV